jgi:hemerythrin-like domain-containing protein
MSRPATTDDAVAQHSLTQLDALPLSMLDEPLDFVSADHFRQRSLCRVLRSFARSRRVPRESAGKVAAYLAHDLSLHHQDEDADLFPALRKRAEPEDGLSTILARLSEDHRQALPLISDIVAALSAKPMRGRITISAAAAETMFAYIEGEQRHLSVEAGIVLVIARKRLASADLRELSRSMKTRRGVEAA